MNSRRVALASVDNAEALLMYLSGFDNITFVCNSCSVKLISALSRLYLVWMCRIIITPFCFIMWLIYFHFHFSFFSTLHMLMLVLSKNCCCSDLQFPWGLAHKSFCLFRLQLLKNKAYVVLLLCFGSGIAVFTCLSTLLEQILCVQGYTDVRAPQDERPCCSPWGAVRH